MAADRGAPQTASPGRPFRALIGVVARTSGAAALRRALPTYLGLFVVAVILFAGNGVRSSDVVALAMASPPTRVGLLAAWLLMALPAARALIAAPSAFLIRTWPIPRARLLGVTTAMLVLVELPWLLLWFKGGGVVPGLAATAIALGGHGLLLARPRGAAEIAAALLCLIAVAILPRPAAALRAGVLAVVLAVRRAFIAAPEQIGVRRARRWVRAGRSAVVALAQMHLATIARAQRPALLRAFWFAAGGALLAGLAAANNGIVDLAGTRAILAHVGCWRLAGAVAGSSGRRPGRRASGGVATRGPWRDVSHKATGLRPGAGRARRVTGGEYRSRTWSLLTGERRGGAGARRGAGRAGGRDDRRARGALGQPGQRPRQRAATDCDARRGRYPRGVRVVPPGCGVAGGGRVDAGDSRTARPAWIARGGPGRAGRGQGMIERIDEC